MEITAKDEIFVMQQYRIGRDRMKFFRLEIVGTSGRLHSANIQVNLDTRSGNGLADIFSGENVGQKGNLENLKEVKYG